MPGASDHRDLRQGGRWSAAQRLKNDVLYAVITAGFRVADMLPRRALLFLGRLTGWLAHAAAYRLRRVARANLSRFWAPAQARARAARSFVHAGENLAYCLLLRRSSVRAADLVLVRDAALAELDAALEVGRGVVFISPHLGPFEAIAARVAELGKRPVVVVRESYDPRLDAWVDAHRTGRGIEVIHRGAPGAGRRIVRALRDGRPVGFLPDLGSRVASAPTEWLGARLDFPVGPQQLAARLACPIVVGALVPRADDGPPFELEMCRISAASTGTAELTQRVASALGERILNAAEHWLWMARPIGTNCRRHVETDTLVRGT
jgi:KDO2-lipid IV(A) lauroyltransferase